MIYSFSFFNNNLVVEIFDYILKNNIEVKDPLDLIKLYHEKCDHIALNNCINNHFKEWVIEYNLDNPRDNFIYYSEVYQDNKDDEKTEKRIPLD
jgi:hypothetical protein